MRPGALNRSIIAASTVGLLAVAGCGTAADPSVVQAPAAAGRTGPAASPEIQTIKVTVANGEVQGGLQTVDVPFGAIFRLVVTSDVADEVHLHGYDIKKDVPAGGTVSIQHTATIPGVVMAELEDAGLTLVKISSS